MSNRVIECASRAGRDFSEFMKGEKDMMQVLAAIDKANNQLAGIREIEKNRASQ